MPQNRASLVVVGILLLSGQAWAADAPPAGGAFADACCLGTSRSDHTATLLANGFVLMAGGRGPAPASLSSAEIYDMVRNAFRPTGGMAQARSEHTATLLRNGKVLVAGGVAGTFVTGTAELYDPVAGSFSTTPNMAAARTQHTATLLPSGKVLIAGGVVWNGAHPHESSAAEIYDPGTGTFTATGNLLAERTQHTATLLSNGKVLIAGGRKNSPDPVATAEIYDPATGSFTATGPLATARMSHTATLLPNGKVLVAGGSGAEGQTLASAELYDPASGVFTATGGMSAPRASHAAVDLIDGRVLVTGGNDATRPTPNAELYDANAGSFSTTSPMHGARDRHTSTRLGNGQVLVAGGVSLDGAFLCPELYTPPAVTCTLPPQVYFGSIVVGGAVVAPPLRTNTAAEMFISVSDDEPLPEERLQCVAAGASGACAFQALQCTTLAGISMHFRTSSGPGTCRLHFVARDASGMLGIGFAEVQVVP
jgi:hypothetical protein